MKKKAVDRIESEDGVDFVHVILATIYMVRRQRFEKSVIPEGISTTGLHFFKNPCDIVGQFPSEPPSVVQKFMPAEKPYPGVHPIENTIEMGRASAAGLRSKDSPAYKQPWKGHVLASCVGPAFATTPVSVGIRLKTGRLF